MSSGAVEVVETTLFGAGRAPANSRQLAAAIDAFNLRWEIGIYRLMAVLIVAASAMIVSISPAIGSELAVPELVLCGISIAYFAASSVIVRGMDARRLELIRRVSATVEASFATMAIGIAAHVKGAEWATTSPMILIYALAIVACSVRIRPYLTALATAVACLEWVLLYAFRLAPELNESTSVATALGWACWERCFWIALIGGTATFATMQVRRTALAGGWQAIRRAWVMQEMSKFLSSEATEVALNGRAQRGLVDRRELTVLFCDLRDFTGLCERERPASVMELLNSFLEQACRVIRENGGQINKFLGDGFLALFDERSTEGNHAAAAVRAARELADVAESLRQRGGIWEQLSIGIGLDSGPVLVGTLGADERLELTAIGRTVNRAARLQALAGRSPERIILSEACVFALADEVPVREVGEVVIKGVTSPVRIYTPAG